MSPGTQNEKIKDLDKTREKCSSRRLGLRYFCCRCFYCYCCVKYCRVFFVFVASRTNFSFNACERHFLPHVRVREALGFSLLLLLLLLLLCKYCFVFVFLLQGTSSCFTLWICFCQL
jgi:hypothetical protein